jgi:hypothetical protein
MRNLISVFGLVIVLSLAASAQQLDPNGPQLEIQGREAVVQFGHSHDGRGAMRIQGPSGVTTMVGGRPWSNTTVTRGQGGQLIVSDPLRGQVIMEPGRNGRTQIQTNRGNYTIDNEILLQLRDGGLDEVIQLQVQGR